MEKPAKVGFSESTKIITVYKQILQLIWPHCIPYDVRKQIFRPTLIITTFPISDMFASFFLEKLSQCICINDVC